MKHIRIKAKLSFWSLCLLAKDVPSADIPAIQQAVSYLVKLGLPISLEVV